MRKVTEAVIDRPESWTSDRAAEVGAFFDALAEEWQTRNDPHRAEPVDDAFARGAVPIDGLTLEIGSGTGLLTPSLLTRCRFVVAVDLAFEMLVRAPADLAPRVQADASRLPLPDGSVTCAVLINAFLFPEEMARVLAPHGALLWVNTSGERTPIYLSAEAVDAALPGRWEGVAAEAGWGTWSVHRRPT